MKDSSRDLEELEGGRRRKGGGRKERGGGGGELKEEARDLTNSLVLSLSLSRHWSLEMTTPRQ